MHWTMADRFEKTETSYYSKTKKASKLHDSLSTKTGLMEKVSIYLWSTSRRQKAE